MLENVWKGREASTVNNYCLCIRKFLSYALENNISTDLPLNSTTVAVYLTHLKMINTPKGTLNMTIAGLKWLHSFIPGVNKWNNPLNDEFLSKIMNGFQRETGKSRNQKKPLTGDLVRKIIQVSDLSDLIQLRDSLMISLAYNLLLRFDEISHITCSHITKNTDGFKILIPKSKTDKFRNGKHVFLPESLSQSSTAGMLSEYLKLTKLNIGQNHFLFCPLKKCGITYALSNKILAYTSFRDIVKKAVKKIGLDDKLYGTHSCRSGGATDLAPRVSEHDLLISGRWADARSIRSYVEVSDQARFEMSGILQSSMGSNTSEIDHITN